ncbi:MAG: PaaI family thioesterase [Lachnospiraceae bacterium]|nr:PaaI family thioesterase [Lachnospiraceae bacterium]
MKSGYGPEKEDLAEMKAFFANDYFAKNAGIEILAVRRAQRGRPSYAKCGMRVTENHLNASGYVMGGAIYTLADLTAAVASNVGQPVTVSQAGQISYLRGADCRMLYAEAESTFSGKKTNFTEVSVRDENGTLIAKATFNGFRILKES